MSFFIKWKQNYTLKLHSMMTHVLMSWFKKSTERWKTSLLNETVENADLHEAVLNKAMTTQEWCVKYDFVAPLSFSLITVSWIWYTDRKYPKNIIR